MIHDAGRCRCHCSNHVFRAAAVVAVVIVIVVVVVVVVPRKNTERIAKLSKNATIGATNRIRDAHRGAALLYALYAEVIPLLSLQFTLATEFCGACGLMTSTKTHATHGALREQSRHATPITWPSPWLITLTSDRSELSDSANANSSTVEFKGLDVIKTKTQT
jgi:hypothetical protein